MNSMVNIYSLSHCQSFGFQQLPEAASCRHPSSLLLHLRAVPACVSVVAGGFTDGAGVVPQDGAENLPVIWFQLVRSVHIQSLPVLLAEVAVVRGGPAAAGVRPGTGCAGLRWVFGGFLSPNWSLHFTPESRLPHGWAPFVLVFYLTAAAHPLQHFAQIHVVMPHVETAPAGEDGALDIESSWHCGHFWGKSIWGYVAVHRIYRCLKLGFKWNNAWTLWAAWRLTAVLLLKERTKKEKKKERDAGAVF